MLGKSMESTNQEEKTQKEIKKLENFLKTVNAKYEIKDNEDSIEVIVYGEIGESIFLNPKIFHGQIYNIDIKLSVRNTIYIYFDNDSFKLNGFSGNQLITKKIRNVSYIVAERDMLYIVF